MTASEPVSEVGPVLRARVASDSASAFVALPLGIPRRGGVGSSGGVIAAASRLVDTTVIGGRLTWQPG